MEGVYEGRIDLQRGFATREHEHLAALIGDVVKRESLTDDLVGRHLGELRELGVAPGATQVATAEAHKDGRNAGVGAFALEGVEYFVDFIIHR